MPPEVTDDTVLHWNERRLRHYQAGRCYTLMEVVSAVYIELASLGRVHLAGAVWRMAPADVQQQLLRSAQGLRQGGEGKDVLWVFGLRSEAWWQKTRANAKLLAQRFIELSQSGPGDVSAAPGNRPNT